MAGEALAVPVAREEAVEVKERLVGRAEWVAMAEADALPVALEAALED